MKKVAILTAGTLPVPPVRGGAVENLINLLIKENEKEHKLKFYVFSIFDKKAAIQSRMFKYTEFRFIKIPFFVKVLDYLTFIWFAKIIRKRKKMSYRYIFSRLYYIFVTGLILHRNNYSNVILENHATLYLCIKLFHNYKKYSGKYIYHAHNELSGFYGCLKEIQNTSSIIGVSSYIIKRIKKQVNKFSQDTKFFVLNNRIDRKSFLSKIDKNKEIKIRQKLKISANTKVVLFTGRMSKEKGIDILIKAWSLLNLKNSVLLIVGSYYFNLAIKNDKYQEELNSLIKKNKNIKFTGYIDYNEMPNIYNLASLVVLPSMWDDPAPLTVIETLTLGKPLITTYSGGIPEYATPKDSILLRRDENIISSLATSIKLVLNSPKLQRKLERQALKNTKEWTSEQYFRDFLSILNK